MTPFAGRITETVQTMLLSEDSDDTIIFLLVGTKTNEKKIGYGAVIRGTSQELSSLVRIAKKDPETGTVVKAVILSNTFA